MKGVQTKLVEHCCNAACPVIVSLYKAGRTSLDHFKLLDVGICIRVPDTRSILHSRTNQGLVALFLYPWWTIPDVPPKEIEAVGCFLHCVINMLIPGKIRADCGAEILGLFDSLQMLIMEAVIANGRILLFGYP